MRRQSVPLGKAARATRRVSSGTMGGLCGGSMARAFGRAGSHHRSRTEARAVTTPAASLLVTSPPASLFGLGRLKLAPASRPAAVPQAPLGALQFVNRLIGEMFLGGASAKAAGRLQRVFETHREVPPVQHHRG